jgi:hypothetical protein
MNMVAKKKLPKQKAEKKSEKEIVISPVPNRQMPWFGWLGLAIIITSEILLYLRNHPVEYAFTAIMWTGYILLLDGWIWARGGKSYFKDQRREWPMLALLSILIWIMFEVFNFKLRNWDYIGLPDNLMIKEFLYFWSFATIIPALFRTTDLFGTYNFFKRTHNLNIKFTPFLLALSFVIGLGFTFIPPMTSYDFAPNLIPFVWLGFIFLIEPINYRLGAPSIYRELEEGNSSFLWQILAAGLFCGILWETWNQQSVTIGGASWQYFVAKFWTRLCFDLKYGQMPLIGFGGYPPFIWECYALYQLCKWAMQGDKLWKSPQVVS